MKIKSLRTWLNFSKFLFLLTYGLSLNPLAHGLSEGRWVIFCVIVFGTVGFFAFLMKSRAHTIDRVILRGVAWENKSSWNYLLTTGLLYGLALTLTLPPLAFRLLSGLGHPGHDWHHQLCILGVSIVLLRILGWLTMPL